MSNNTIDNININIKDINKNYYILFNELLIINKNEQNIIFDKFIKNNYKDLISYNFFSKLNIKLDKYLNRTNINCNKNDYIYYDYLKNFKKNKIIYNKSNLTNLIINCIIYYILNYDIQKINKFKNIIEESIITYEKEKIFNDYFNIKIYFNKNIFKQLNNLNLNINIILKNRYYNNINSINNVSYIDENNKIFNLNNDKKYSKIIYYNDNNIGKFKFYENNNIFKIVLYSNLKIQYLNLLFNNENNIYDKNNDDEDEDDIDDYDNYEDEDYEDDNSDDEDFDDEDFDNEDFDNEDFDDEDFNDDNFDDEDNIKEPQLKKKKIETIYNSNASKDFTKKNRLFIKYICQLCNIDKDNINIDNIQDKENFICNMLLKDENGNIITFNCHKKGRPPGKRNIYKFKLNKDIEQLGYKKDDTIGFGFLYPRCKTTIKMKKYRYFIILKKSKFSETDYYITHMFYHKNNIKKEIERNEFKELSKEKIYKIYNKLKNIYQTIQNVKKN